MERVYLLLMLMLTGWCCCNVRLSSFNVRNLSSLSRTDQELAVIALIVSRYDFVALQEVLDVEVIGRLCAILSEEFNFNCAYSVSEQVGRIKKERYAFVWRSDVFIEGDGYIYSDDGEIFEREPYCKEFDVDSYNFAVCTIHVIFGDGLDERRVEINELNNVYIDAKAKLSENVFIFGDFNMDPYDNSWSSLQSSGLNHVIGSPYKTTIGDVSLYDNIWYHNESSNVVVDSEDVYIFDGNLLPSNQREIVNLIASDHRPVSVVVKTSSTDSSTYFVYTNNIFFNNFGIATWKVSTSAFSPSKIGILCSIFIHYDFFSVQGIPKDVLNDVVSVLVNTFGIEYYVEHRPEIAGEGLAFLYRHTIIKNGNSFLYEGTFSNQPFCTPFQSGNFTFTACNIDLEVEDTSKVLTMVNDLSSSHTDIILCGNFGIESDSSSWDSLKNVGYIPVMENSIQNIWHNYNEFIQVDAQKITFDNKFPPTVSSSYLSDVEPLGVSVINGDPSNQGIPDCRLFMSEYIEGTSYNKAIELYNPTDDDINLNYYSIRKIVNGGTWLDATSLELSGVVPSKSTFVIAHPSISADVLDNVDFTSGSMNFDGNDAIALYCNGLLLDIVGKEDINASLYLGWDVSGVASATSGHTLIRRSYVDKGNQNFSPGTNRYNSEWIVKSIDDMHNLGIHNMAKYYDSHGSFVSLIISDYVEGSSNNKALQLFNIQSFPIDLSPYRLKKLQNGGNWSSATGIPISGILEPHDYYIISHSSASPDILELAAVKTGSMNIDGNDALIVLLNETTVVDQLGTDGPSPSVGWDVAGVSSATKDHTLKRKNYVFSAKSSWEVEAGTNSIDSTWIVLPLDTFNLGNHSLIGGCHIYHKNIVSEQLYCCDKSIICPNLSTCNTTTYFCEEVPLLDTTDLRTQHETEQTRQSEDSDISASSLLPLLSLYLLSTFL